jgi:CheY-like chemotaxis protein
MGGKEAAAALRAAGTTALLVASSGYATDPVMAQYREYQFDAVLSKPYNFSELTSMLAGLVQSPPAR